MPCVNRPPSHSFFSAKARSPLHPNLLGSCTNSSLVQFGQGTHVALPHAADPTRAGHVHEPPYPSPAKNQTLGVLISPAASVRKMANLIVEK